MFIILIQTLISPIKTIKSLIDQGFPIKNKHCFYDTLSYHNYGAYLNADYNLDTTANAVQKAVHTMTLIMRITLTKFVF